MALAADGTIVGAAPALWKTLLTGCFFAAKVVFFIFTFIWVRWTIPRFRYDQVMSLGWKVMIPLLVVYIAAMGGAMLYLDRIGVEFGLRYVVYLAVLNAVMMAAIVFWLDRRRIITGSAWKQARLQRVD